MLNVSHCQRNIALSNNCEYHDKLCCLVDSSNSSVLTVLPCYSEISGTTCATVLTKAIFTEGCKSVAAGMNAMDLRRGITMAVDDVVTNLKGMARMISTSEEIAQVTLEIE